ncbi:glycosyltransferase family 1 protein [Bradyrhizobium sp. 62]|uniref:glycosyltransferase family 4 protein n=1 Tax=Bradyrhizobium sp. 62 TaxID=1043588 RepID=UPI001FFB5CCB|nr:glycosyltransferase family 1 protein [Bradyrhizobium sp. 62]MCK1364152.1 glycosyltransferase family 4 protein [Bradyrhizobium sp. 62]
MTKLGVVVLSAPDLGGTYQYSLSMLEALRHTQAYEITLYADPSNKDLVKLGYPIRKFTEPRWKQLSYLAADALGLKLEDPFVDEDILIAPIYSLALLQTAKPFVYTLHDLQEFYYPQNFSWAQRLWRRRVHVCLSRRAGRIICESEYVKSDIVRFFGVRDECVAVIAAPPLRQRTAEFDAAELEEVRGRLRLPDRFILYPAQFWPHKNHLRLIDAFKQVVAKAPELKLVLTGKKRDDYEVVMRAVGEAGLEGNILHLGYIEQSDLQAIYHLAAALVMPSLFESVSIPIYEAFEAGTPVAASNILSIPEQVGSAALQFDPFSSSSIAESILKLAHDPGLAKRLGALGRDRIASMTPQTYCSRLQNLLTQIANAKVIRAD